MKVIKDEGIISCVMAFDPGSKSGAVVERDNRVPAYIVHYANDKLNISYLKGDGTKREMPSLDVKNAEAEAVEIAQPTLSTAAVSITPFPFTENCNLIRSPQNGFSPWPSCVGSSILTW